MADNRMIPPPIARYILLQSLRKRPPTIDETVLPDVPRLTEPNYTLSFTTHISSGQRARSDIG